MKVSHPQSIKEVPSPKSQFPNSNHNLKRVRRLDTIDYKSSYDLDFNVFCNSFADFVDSHMIFLLLMMVCKLISTNKCHSPPDA